MFRIFQGGSGLDCLGMERFHFIGDSTPLEWFWMPKKLLVLTTGMEFMATGRIEGGDKRDNSLQNSVIILSKRIKLDHR